MNRNTHTRWFSHAGPKQCQSGFRVFSRDQTWLQIKSKHGGRLSLSADCTRKQTTDKQTNELDELGWTWMACMFCSRSWRRVTTTSGWWRFLVSSLLFQVSAQYSISVPFKSNMFGIFDLKLATTSTWCLWTFHTYRIIWANNLFNLPSCSREGVRDRRVDELTRNTNQLNLLLLFY